MGLKYPGEWKFEGVGFGVPWQAVNEFVELMLKISPDSQDGIEGFKSAFGGQRESSSYGFAVSDLKELVHARSANAAEFVDNLWTGIETAKAQNLDTPSAQFVNGFLEKHGIPLRIDPPSLRLAGGDAILIAGDPTEAKVDGVPVYAIGEMIGKGGYGVVHKATRLTEVSEFHCALKILDPSPFVTDYEKALSRFRREVKAIQGLQHRAIIQYYDAGVTAERKPYIVMPFIDGVDLRTAAGATGAITILGMFREITAALAYAHGQGVLHRDLKPSNILVRHSDGQPIILDFGSAYLLDELSSDSLTTGAVGTIGYIPKEVLDNPKTRSPLQDVYACGVMLYECLAGHTPDHSDYRPLTEVDGRYDLLDEIVKTAIAKADKRTNSVGSLVDEITLARDVLAGQV